MSFFLKSVKTKAQRLNTKRKAPVSQQQQQQQAKVSTSHNSKENNKRQRHDLSEEIPSDTDDEEIVEIADYDEDDEDNEVDMETAQEKKLRLAKKYLDDMKHQQEDIGSEDVRMKTISTQLREDILEKSGKLKKLVAKAYTDAIVYKELKQHKLAVTCLVISHDCKCVFSGSKDGSIIKWELETGKRLFQIQKKLASNGNKNGHSDQVLCLALTTDFKYLASGGKDKNINIWNPHDCTHVYVFYGHRDTVTGLTFRFNTHELFSSSYDRCIKLWSVDEMSYIETLFGHQDRILGIDSLNKERCITCGARDRSVRVWKIVDESQLVFQGTHFDSIDCVCLINDENFLSGSNDGSLALWHMSKKKPLNIKQMAHYDETSKQATWITSVAALHNTDLIASGSNDGLLRIWRCSDDFFKIEHLFNVKLNGFINDLKFSTDGKYIVAAIGQEHKYGRWSTVKDCRNSVVIVKLNKTEI